jgi:peptide/nickel transport system substrate-binding protein
MAGSVELTLGRSLSGEQAIQVRDQWRDGRLELSYENWIALFPQFINPNPAAVGDVRFRRALLHATDRQQMVEVLMSGLSAVGHSWLNPGQAEYREIEARNVVRYEYDPRRATQLIESVGYTRGPDGIYRDSANQRLNVEIRTTVGDDLREKILFTIVDEWQRVGVSAEPVMVPRQLAADLEYRATFPAFEIVRNPNDVRGTRTLHSRYTALPENNFRVTGNRTRYQNPELDGLVDRYFMTIPLRERMEVMGQIVHHMSDQVVILGVVYNTSATLMSNRLQNVIAGREGATQAWNAHLWDVRG